MGTVLCPVILRLFRRWIGSNLMLGKILLWIVFITGVGKMLSYLGDLLGEDPHYRESMKLSWENLIENGISVPWLSFYITLLLPLFALFWSKKLRYVFLLAILSNFSALMYIFVVFTTTLHRDYYFDTSTDSYVGLLWYNGLDDLVTGGVGLAAILILIQKSISKSKPTDPEVLDSF